MKTGLMPHIRMRPFDLIADPRYLPRDIFVSAVETPPFLPPAEMQVKGHEEDFKKGLDVLRSLTTGKVYLIYHSNSTSDAFTLATNVEKVEIEGPHPAANASVHIHKLAPIRGVRDIVWTLTTNGVIAIGKMARTGKYHTQRVVALGGDGFALDARQYYATRMGASIKELVATRLMPGSIRLISGDPLTGQKVTEDDFYTFLIEQLQRFLRTRTANLCI